jgi:hypothetical protein
VDFLLHPRVKPHIGPSAALKALLPAIQWE